MNIKFCDLRKEKGYTQQELADRIGIKQSAVAMWESGKAIPSTRTLIKLGKIFEMPIEELLGCFDKSLSDEQGNTLKELLTEKGVTQDCLAKELGVHQTLVSQWCCGKTRPTIYHVAKIATLLNTTVERVFECFIPLKEQTSNTHGE